MGCISAVSFVMFAYVTGALVTFILAKLFVECLDYQSDIKLYRFNSDCILAKQKLEYILIAHRKLPYHLSLSPKNTSH